MGFNTYPALSIRQPDIGKTLITAAYLKSAGLKNRLMEGKLRKQKTVQGLGAQIMSAGGVPLAGGTAGPGGQLPGAMGDAASASPMIDPASPAMRELMAVDPEVGTQYLDAVTSMNKQQRERFQELNGAAARLLRMVEDAPEEQRPMFYAQALEMARQQGVPVEGAPPQYDPQWVQNQIQVTMALDEELTAIERKASTEGIMVQTAKGRTFQRYDQMEEGDVYPDAPPSGYQRTDEGLEFIPGGPQDPAAAGALAEAQRAPEDDEKATAAMRNAEALGLRPGTQEYNEYVRDVTLKPLVSIGGQETERQKKYGGAIGTYYGELYTGVQGAAREGRKQAANLDRLDQLLDQTETGFGREFILKARKLGETLGFETAGIETDVAPGEAAMALSNEMALQLRNPAGGAGMPGQLSDKDREFLVSMVPGLGQTRAGRKLLIRTRKKLARRAGQVAELARKYHREQGALDAGFEDELAEWSEKNPLFTAEDFTARESARLPSPQSAAERDALVPGTYYRSPDGQVRRTAVR